MTPPPESFFELVSPRDREAARAFYKKYLDVEGLPVVAAAEVDDRALERTREIVSGMLAGRPDVMASFRKTGMYLIIIGRNQNYTDMPENRFAANPDYLNERVRGTGGRPTSFGEENLLSLSMDRYDDESIGVHEFAHTIETALRFLDPAWGTKLAETYRGAMEGRLYERAYAATNIHEYWAEIVQAYFDCNRINNWNHGPVGTREVLKAHDPAGYELVRAAFNTTPETDWRYRWLQTLPMVETPPAKFKLDPFYTKFTYAREFPVAGRGASDAALLKANDTVRKLFTYRHDILKALIEDGAKLVVLGKGERVGDLPEARLLAGVKGFDPKARVLDYTPEARTLVVPEENVMGDPAQPVTGDNHVIAVMARAVIAMVAQRPPLEGDGRNRGEQQQYEIGVERMDRRFDVALQALLERARTAGRWRGTPATGSSAAYFAQGVLAYFDAAGAGPVPEGAAKAVRTRADLASYDPALLGLIHQTMAYEGRVDWRFAPAQGSKPNP